MKVRAVKMTMYKKFRVNVIHVLNFGSTLADLIISFESVGSRQPNILQVIRKKKKKLNALQKFNGPKS